MANRIKHGLVRKLGLFPVTNIVIANMIGAGIFTTSGLLMGDLKNPLLMIALWIIGGFIALCGALSYGELGAAIPQAGGEYIFLSKLYNPMFGFLSGWISFIVGFSAPIAASSLGFSEYLTRAAPQLLGLGDTLGFDDPLLIKKLISILVIVVFTVVHLRGIEFGSKVQNYLTILKIGLIIGFIVIGISFGKGEVEHFIQGSSFTFNFGGWKVIGLSLMWIMFAYSGWNAATYIGSEVEDPIKNLPRSLLLGTAIVTLLYLGLNIFYVYAVAPENMEGVISIGGLAMGSLFGKSMDNLVSLLIAFALLSSISAFIILGPRVYFSMARDGYFFQFLSKLHPAHHVPSMAILLQGLFSIIIVLSGTLEQILTYMGFSLGIFPILTVAGVFKLRRSDISVLKLPGFPVVQIIYILFGTSMLVLAFLERTVESSIAILTVLVGVPVYFIFKRIYQNSATSSVESHL